MADFGGSSALPPHPDKSRRAPGLARSIERRLHLLPVPLVPEISLYTAHPGSRLSRLAGAGGAPVYWAYPWAGGQVLARYILDHPGSVAGLRVLDLGSGSGLVAIAAAIAGAGTVVAADTDANAIAAMGVNFAANRVSAAVIATDLLDGPPPAIDVVVAGDVFYDQETSARVIAFLDRCVQAGISVLIGDPFRAYLPLDRLRLIRRYAVRDFGLPKGDSPKPAGLFAFEAPPANAAD